MRKGSKLPTVTYYRVYEQAVTGRIVVSKSGIPNVTQEWTELGTLEPIPEFSELQYTDRVPRNLSWLFDGGPVAPGWSWVYLACDEPEIAVETRHKTPAMYAKIGEAFDRMRIFLNGVNQ